MKSKVKHRSIFKTSDTKTPRKDKRKKHHSVRKNKGYNNNILECNDLTYLFLWKFIENQDPKKSSKSTSRSTVKGKKKGKEITCNQV